MLEQRPNPRPGNGHDPRYARRQRGRMWLAIFVLVAALAVVLVKDHQFWFSSEDETVEDEASTPTTLDKTRPDKKAQSNPAAAAKKKEQQPSAKSSDQTAVVVPPAMIETQRAAVPPLSVQIVSGNTNRILSAGGGNALQVEIPAISGEWRVWSGTEAGANGGSAVNAEERVRMPVDGPETDQGAGDRSYPLLRKQMRVRGSVVLQALVSADGNIVDLRVLSGPAVLASAAREVVREWRFKPYLQNGHAVETQAKITVKFLISTT